MVRILLVVSWGYLERVLGASQGAFAPYQSFQCPREASRKPARALPGSSPQNVPRKHISNIFFMSET